MMEVYAAAVAQRDHEIGRVLDSLEQSAQLDNTLVIYIEGDNGASGEGILQGTTNEMGGNLEPESVTFKLSMADQLGSDQTYNHYLVGWAHAMDAPFQWSKQVASHFGGTRNGIGISWPKGIKARGEILSQFQHVIDIVTTSLELLAIQAPSTITGTPRNRLRVSAWPTHSPTRKPLRFTPASISKSPATAGYTTTDGSQAPLRCGRHGLSAVLNRTRKTFRGNSTM